MSSLQTLPGFREIYPEDCSRLHHIFRVWRQVAISFGFQAYETPVLEPLDLFRAKSGAEIEQQLFSFVDKGGREVALRPEMTPALARMVSQRAQSLRRPVKWFNIGEHFRYERQQKGRLRSFYQFNADVFGEAGPGAEVELVALLIRSLTVFGLTQEDFWVRLSDRDLWVHFLATRGLSGEEIEVVLGIIDKMGREPREVSAKKIDTLVGDRGTGLFDRIEKLAGVRSMEALESFFAENGTDGQSDEIRVRLADWRVLISGLEAMGLSAFVSIDLSIVRGLAYYTGFVFEAFDRKGKFRSIAGGGRYNHLVGKLGGPELPATGFAIGDVVLQDLLEDRGLSPKIVSGPEFYVVASGEAERGEALADISALRGAGYSVEYPLRAAGFGKQFKAAGQSGARFSLIYGSEELGRGMVKARNMADGSEQEIPRNHLLEAVRDLRG
ncbi:MAG: histidine--tRNA ligase [Verrucomicrobia bacterium]|nr:MAG: histidine--tRNA ligase [Verrucomicrobiota bacterium]